MSSTSCPLPSSSMAMERPTDPAPAIATRMSELLSSGGGWLGEGGGDALHVALVGDHVQHVALLQDGAVRGQHLLTQPGDERVPGRGRLLKGRDFRPEPVI